MAPRKVFVATIQIAIEAESQSEAVDSISEMLSGSMEEHGGNTRMDWGYLKVGAQWLYPSRVFVSESWTIGELSS